MKILLAGVGGQGILFVTRILAELALLKGWSVMGAETHGMAQRGGSVVSHLKINQNAASPLIRQGAADLLFGLEENEGIRYLGYLRTGGRVVVNEVQGKFRLPAVQEYLREKQLICAGLDASERALELGYPLGTNLILLGAALALGWLPFSAREMEKVLAKISRSTLVESNLKSLRCGLQASGGDSPWRKGENP